jgi:hypothetical protein
MVEIRAYHESALYVGEIDLTLVAKMLRLLGKTYVQRHVEGLQLLLMFLSLRACLDTLVT